MQNAAHHRNATAGSTFYFNDEIKDVRCKWSMQEAACHQDATVGSAFLFKDEIEDIEV